MTGDQAAVAAVAWYLFLRWWLHPLTVRLPTGVELLADVTGAVLLLPEYACTWILRRVIDRPAPLAFIYGELVCGVACGLRAAGLTIADGARRGSARIGHTQAVIGGLVGSFCLVLLT